nr:PQQ-binding-like beta-propeller repeat protein [Corallococcus exiguus]
MPLIPDERVPRIGKDERRRSSSAFSRGRALGAEGVVGHLGRHPSYCKEKESGKTCACCILPSEKSGPVLRVRQRTRQCMHATERELPMLGSSRSVFFGATAARTGHFEGTGPLVVKRSRWTAIRWSVSCGSEATSSPRVVDDDVYVGTRRGGVVAVDARTGAERRPVKAGAMAERPRSKAARSMPCPAWGSDFARSTSPAARSAGPMRRALPTARRPPHGTHWIPG